MRCISICLIACLLLASSPLWSAQRIIQGPEGSGAFGRKVAVLPNRNFVVTDENYSVPGGAQNVGAAYLFHESGQLISSLTGTSANDGVGHAIVVLPENGNFLILSPFWSGLRGAVTWCSAETGCSGEVSVSNSLIGTGTDNLLGSPTQVFTLSNGNYVMSVIGYDDGPTPNVGAVAWGSGTSGVQGEIGIANAMIGSSANDKVGDGVLPLSNGNYAFKTLFWDDTSNGIVDAGAVTFGNGTTGSTGVVSSANSLVSDQSNSGTNPINLVALSNGNYLIGMPRWNGSRGALTLAPGDAVIAGTPNSGRSLVGGNIGDAVGGMDRMTALSNGNYVVRNPDWNQDRGAVTFGSGITGVTGVVSSANSLVGTATTHEVGTRVLALPNGNYVVASERWDDGAVMDVGAITFGSGITGVSGEVSASNSLIGATTLDLLGKGGQDALVALSGGGYAVYCETCDLDGVVNSGSLTVAPGTGLTGVLGSANALRAGIGTSGSSNQFFLTPLSDGNVVFVNRTWRTPSANNLGSVTWIPASGLLGVVDASNSFVGSTQSDSVGFGGITPLSNGNYVISTPNWTNPDLAQGDGAGAVTLAQGGAPFVGTISAANSLVGSKRQDFVGNGRVWALPNGHFVVRSYQWDNGAAVDAGALTWGSGSVGVTGPITASNSWIGTRNNDRVGVGTIRIFADSYWVASSELWDAPGISSIPVFNAGAVTLGLPLGNQIGQAGVFGNEELSGVLSARNSAIGSVAGVASPTDIPYAYNPSTRPQERTLIVGQQLQNRVVLQSYDGFFEGGFE